MTDVSFYTELAKTIPVVIGGLLAVGGGLIGQVATHRLTAKREQAKLRRERLESLVKALYAHYQWLDDKLTQLLFRSGAHDTPSPLDEVRMIQALYFPELSDEVTAILKTQLPMLEFIYHQHADQMNDLEAWRKAWKSRDRDQYTIALTQYLMAVEAMTKKCRELLLATGELTLRSSGLPAAAAELKR